MADKFVNILVKVRAGQLGVVCSTHARAEIIRELSNM